ncbi:hypothetical protein ACFPU1_01880 [Thalassorhabdus alkalitolerans]|uniref:Uncharacterized protein n=1 Tax=Thalassorhabdus alkalitolerans TaxID=2282697 RepID=A0ABW0YGI0_9BACI
MKKGLHLLDRPTEACQVDYEPGSMDETLLTSDTIFAREEPNDALPKKKEDQQVRSRCALL